MSLYTINLFSITICDKKVCGNNGVHKRACYNMKDSNYMQEGMQVHILWELVPEEKILSVLHSRNHHGNRIRRVQQQRHDNHNHPFRHDHKQVRKNH